MPSTIQVWNTTVHKQAVSYQNGQKLNDGSTVLCFYQRGEPGFCFTNFAENYPITAYDPVLRQNITYKTTEHYFQANKFTDQNLRRQIINTPQASDARKLAGELGKQTPQHTKAKLGTDWFDNEEFNVMRNALFLKLIQHPILMNILIDFSDTQQPKKRFFLIEGSFEDDKWGTGRDMNGRNLLGICFDNVINYIILLNTEHHLAETNNHDVTTYDNASQIVGLPRNIVFPNETGTTFHLATFPYINSENLMSYLLHPISHPTQQAQQPLSPSQPVFVPLSQSQMTANFAQVAHRARQKTASERTQQTSSGAQHQQAPAPNPQQQVVEQLQPTRQQAPQPLSGVQQRPALAATQQQQHQQQLPPRPVLHRQVHPTQHAHAPVAEPTQQTLAPATEFLKDIIHKQFGSASEVFFNQISFSQNTNCIILQFPDNDPYPINEFKNKFKLPKSCIDENTCKVSLNERQLKSLWKQMGKQFVYKDDNGSRNLFYAVKNELHSIQDRLIAYQSNAQQRAKTPFRFFHQSRTVNRSANIWFARELSHQTTHITKDQLEAAYNTRKLYFKSTDKHKRSNHGINSKELNGIIRDIRRGMAK